MSSHEQARTLNKETPMESNNNELPGMLALQQGVEAQVWPHTMDARVWADELNKTLVQLGHQPFDPGWLIGWFANAIMAGFDTASLRHSGDAILLDAAHQNNENNVRQIRGLQAKLETTTAALAQSTPPMGVNIIQEENAKLRLEIRRLQATPQWTSKQPNEQGWYWWIANQVPNNTMLPVIVYVSHDFQISAQTLKVHGKYIDEVNGQFAGPLSPPEETA